MRIKFIAQGLAGQSETVGNYLCSSFKDVNYNSFFCFSAFTKESGLKFIINEIDNERIRFKKIHFYLGISEKGTSKEALELLLSKNLKTWTFCTSSQIIFHPKIYVFEGEKVTRIIVGSSNLTKAGLFDNIEASTVIEFKNDDIQGQKYKNEILTYFENILNGTDPNVEILSNELIQDFVDSGFVVDEINTKDFNDLSNRNKELFAKRKSTKINENELGDIKTKKFITYSTKTHEFKITDQYLNTWPELFEEFLKYKEVFNSVSVSKDYGKRLYDWYRKQKIFYTNNTIPEEHLNKLIEVGFHFGDANELRWAKAWEDKYNELVDFYIKNGYSAIKRIRDKNNPLKQLSDWVAFQRTYRRKGQLSDYEIERLNEIDFIWEVPNFGGQIDDETWFLRYLELESYKKKHGNCNPPQLNPDKTQNQLGRWVNDQMTLKNVGIVRKNKKERRFIEPIREQYLTELGIDWSHEFNKHKSSFEKQMNDFLLFREKYPDLKAPKGEFKKERDWAAQMKSRFSILPDWKKEVLIENGIIRK